MYLWGEAAKAMKYVLYFLLNSCCAQVFLGWAIKRIAVKITMYGQPQLSPPLKPKNYNPGDWIL